MNRCFVRTASSNPDLYFVIINIANVVIIPQIDKRIKII